MRKMITELEDNKIEKQLTEIEAFQDDSRRCYQSIRTIKNNRPEKPTYRTERRLHHCWIRKTIKW